MFKLFIGLFLGGILGIVIMACLTAGKYDDNTSGRN